MKFALLFAFFGVACAGSPQRPVEKSPPRDFTRRLDQASDLEENGHPEEAEEIYHSLREMSLQAHPEVAAIAEWRMSFTAEKSGDDLKAYAHLLTAEKFAASLPETIARAEMPARKAVLLQRLGRPEEASIAAREADRGVQVLMSGLRAKPDPSWLARLSFEMGDSLSQNVGEENLPEYLKSQEVAQKYLLRAISQNDPRWSQRAFNLLKSQYADLWNAMMNLQLPGGLDPRVALKQRRERQIPLLAQFARVLERAQALEPSDANSANEFEKKFAVLRQNLQDETGRLLYASSETTVLTEESRVLSALRRGRSSLGRAKAKPPKIEKDPNL